jgi:hypothetical protein
MMPWRKNPVSTKLSASRSMKIPKELRYLIEETPLVGDEKQEDYEQLLYAIAGAVQPVDFIGWQCVGHIADYSWYIRRERKVKNAIIKHYLEDDFANAMIVAHVIDANEERGSSDKADRLLEKKEQTANSASAAAFMRGASDIDAIDRRIAGYQACIIMILREARLYTDALVRRLEQARDTDDAQLFPEAAE